MFNERFSKLGQERSVIRELFEYGKKRKAEIGNENVFDFSLGNPSIEPPKSVTNSILELVNSSNPTALHGYTSAQGDFSVREAIAESISSRFGVNMRADLIYLTCGAAASLTIALGALVVPQNNEKVLAFAPYFPEYKVFAETAGAFFDVVKPLDDMTIDFDDFEAKIDEHVKAVIVNSPNNPSGVVYDEETIKKIADVLRRKSAEFGSKIFIISDEPYREISYGSVVPYVMNFYDDTVVCYSFSKSLSLPGERIGYVAVSPTADNVNGLYAAILGAGRAFGYVCAPSLFQFVVRENVHATALVEEYRENRDILCDELSKLGYTFAKPDGAFYLFVKSPSGCGDEFSERAKRHELLIVSGTGFGVPSHARISYCVSKKQILASIPAFKALMEEYK